MKNVLVFCGSSAGFDPHYLEESYRLGKILALSNLHLVYGGANVGLMKAVADGALHSGGEVTGVLPSFLIKKELSHPGVTRLIEVETLHQRKLIMTELCDAAIALPGGYGTLDELFEFVTWAQLGIHRKPVALLNINGFFDELLMLTRKMTMHGFLKEANRKMLLVDSDIDSLLQQLIHYRPPQTEKWLK